MSFNSKYNEIIDIINDDLNIVSQNILSSIALDGVLNTELLEFLKSPSKKIRPALGILYLKALNIELTFEHYELFAAIELIHSASLIHDDIIDASALRRGKETINCKFNNKLAVLAGDYVLSVALSKIAHLNKPEILSLFAKTFEEMCVGEIHQHYNLFKIPTLDEYLQKTIHKTANLFATTIEAGLALSQIKNSEAVDFGLNFGIAFQIRDDLLNIISCQKTDKPINSDIDCGIYNAPVIFSGGKENIMTGIEKTYILLNNYIDKSKKSLEQLNDSDYKIALKTLAGELYNV